jgi:hypothetical protein
VASIGRGFQENRPAIEKFLSAILTGKNVEFAGMVQNSSRMATETEKSEHYVLDRIHLNFCRSRVSAEFHFKVSRFISCDVIFCNQHLSVIVQPQGQNLKRVSWGLFLALVQKAPRSSEQSNKQRTFTTNIHLWNNWKHQINDRPERIENPEWGGLLFVL